MRRIRFHGADLQGLGNAGPGAHLKLLVPDLEAGATHMSNAFGMPHYAARIYSLRRFDSNLNLLDVDFVLHGAHGPGTRWAVNAKIGDSIALAGVGGPALANMAADFHILVGDLSALPAIAAVLEALPSQSKGLALIQIEETADQLALQHPAGVEIQWLTAAAPKHLPGVFFNLTWPTEGQVFATIAGESTAVLAIRQNLLQERGLAPSSMYAVPYWRQGWREEDYHAERHRAVDAQP
ncbi:siderophore-interacting protein [Methylomonas sp. EbA]|uniref:Siderophore-interacting protein n=1 Tax=Methylomonas albis TaxID=1854563 RepID=A0ABR9CZ14_9GAMM|nr:siderophore-interacting protein [Methylomonas albis]